MEFLFILLPLLLIALSAAYRRLAGFGAGQTISHDNVTLRSDRYGLIGRPDRIVLTGNGLIVEDKKSATQVYPSHRLQLGVYLLLAEEHFGTRPPYAVVVLRGGRRVKIENTAELRHEVLSRVQQIRAARAALQLPLKAAPSLGKCRACGQRQHCDQRVAGVL